MEPGKGRKGEENRKKKEAWVLSVLSCGKGVLSVLSPIKEDPEYREFWESIKKRVSLLFRLHPTPYQVPTNPVPGSYGAYSYSYSELDSKTEKERGMGETKFPTR